MIYDISLKIAHYYNHPAANSRHLIRVTPKIIEGRQRLKVSRLEVLPEPDDLSEAVDFFGNLTTTCTQTDSHAKMSIAMSCRVEVTAPPFWKDLSPKPTQVRQEWEKMIDLGAQSPLHFLGPASRLTPDQAIAQFAQDVCDPNASTAGNVIAFGQALHDLMTFDATATTVDTDATEAFALKRGVCQDFSHIMILGLQSLGIPMAYVSGYLRTLPPEGGVKLEGADAMHAWVRAWCGAKQGWIEYDPTNATLVGVDHIVVGYGRDYSDVSPVNGHLRSSGGQRNTQAVDVKVVD